MKKIFMLIVALTILFTNTIFTVFADAPTNLVKANSLYELGLFKGSDNGFELDREPTRLEALIMLLRLLGKEKEALESKNIHPFKDVPVWANGYVSYAYSNNLTKGISKDLFGSDEIITSAQFLTFVLRALGYNDIELKNSYTKAYQIGIIDEGRYINENSQFFREDCVNILFNTLMVNKKGSEKTLIQTLVDDNTISTSVAEKVFLSIPIPILTSSEYTIANEDTVIENERFIIKLPKGIMYYNNIEKVIDDVMSVLEKKTGLLFYPTTEMKKIVIDGHKDSLGSWARVADALWIGKSDFLITSGESLHGIVQALSLTLHLRNENYINDKTYSATAFIGGYTQYNVYKYTHLIEYPNYFDTINNTELYENIDDFLSSPEIYFQKVDGWDAYLAGFRFVYYIAKTYGEGKLSEIIKEMDKNSQMLANKAITNTQIIKNITSSSVFEDFVSWYNENKDVFKRNNDEKTIDVNVDNIVDYFPTFWFDNSYTDLKINYSNHLAVNLSNGFMYLQNQDINPTGFFAYLMSSEDTSIQFYDVDGKLIKIVNLIKDTRTKVGVENAVLFKVTSRNGALKIMPINK